MSTILEARAVRVSLHRSVCRVLIGCAIGAMLLGHQPLSGQEVISKSELLSSLVPGDNTVVTRSHSVSMYIDSAYFPELAPGAYAVQLTSVFGSFMPGSTSPQSQTEVHVLFDELLRSGGKQAYRFVPTSRKVLENLPLAGINDVTIRVSINPLDNARQDIFAKYLKPLLGTPLMGGPAAAFVEQFAQPDPKADPATAFETSMSVPLNVVEHKALERADHPFLRAEVPIVVVADGTIPIPDQGLEGLAKNVANGVVSLFSGKRIFRTTRDVRYSGLLYVHFTRGQNVIIPAQIQHQLTIVDQEVSAAAISKNEQQSDAALARLTSLAKSHVEEGSINQSVYQSLISYAAMAKAYTQYKHPYRDWELQFSQALQDATSIGRVYETQVRAVKDIYPNGNALIALPYSLPDDQTVRIVNWQTAMHEALAAGKDYRLQQPTTR